MSNIINKAKELGHEIKESAQKKKGGNEHGDNYGTGADTYGSNTTGTGSGLTGGNTYGSSGTGSGLGGTGTGYGDDNTGRSGNYGPHDSNIANKADPRVDSDRDGSRTAGQGQSTNYGGSSGIGGGNTYGSGTTGGSGLGGSGRDTYGSGTTGGTGLGGTSSGYGDDNTGRSGNYGPHDSNLGNKADPRVDSDRDGSRTAGQGQSTNYGGSSGIGGGDTYGSSGTGSGLGGSGRDTYGSGTTGGSGLGGSGTAGGYGGNNDDNSGRSGNYGPHDSNLANKLDPRVDSDRDGSRTAGQGQSTDRQDQPLDAAKHRPSVFHAQHGDPSIEHEHPVHGSGAGRHGPRSNLEDYSSGATRPS